MIKYVLIFVATFQTSFGLTQTFRMLESFESHNWHAIGFSEDTAHGEYSTDWASQGTTSYKMEVTHEGSGHFTFGTGVFDSEPIGFFSIDAKSESNMRLEIKAVDFVGVEHALGHIDLIAGEEQLDVSFVNPIIEVRKIYLVPSNYDTGTHTIYVDNLQVLDDGGISLWDGFEKHFYWNGSADADNPDFLTARSDDITHSSFSPKNNSTASLVMEWNSTVDSTSNFAQIQVQDIDVDLSDYYYFRFDAFRPTSTENVELYIFLYDGEKGAGTNFIRINEPDRWGTYTVLLGESIDLQSIKELKFVVPNTDSTQFSSGKILIDNLQIGGFTPNNHIADLNTYGTPHLLSDFTRSLEENQFYGIGGIGASIDSSIDQETDYEEHYTEPSLRLNYDLNSSDGFVFFFNTLALNSQKDKLALYVKGGEANPQRMKVEFHDSNWTKSGYSEGSAFAIISGISSVEWKQWIIPIEVDSLTVMGSFDPSDITEVVLSLDYRTADDEAKSGTVFIDDIYFVDKSDVLLPFPGICIPETQARNIQTLGVPYLLDDFDGRVLDENGKVRNQGFNEFFGLASIGYDTARWKDLAIGTISSVEEDDFAHSDPYSYKIEYSFDTDSVQQFVFYFNTLAPGGSSNVQRDFSFLEYFSLWLRGHPEGNPGSVIVEFHDDTWQSSNFTNGKAACTLLGIDRESWKQWIIPIKRDSLVITGEIDFRRITEVVISYDYSRVKDKSGILYLDDLSFIDRDEKYIAESDFKKEEFLELVSKRTFQYFLDAVDDDTGLVLDRAHFTDLATVAGVGFGLTAMIIGAERGWVSLPFAEEYTLKVLSGLLSTPQGPEATGTSGYKGFFYHFLDARTGLRKDTTVELSIVDTGLLLAGAITVREYFSWNSEIRSKVDSLYDRIDWPWYLDTINSDNFNQFYLGWSPENGFVGHWDFATDEVILINLLAIGSPSHPVSTDVFYAWQREMGTYQEYSFYQSFFGAMFQYFFANCWYDLYSKEDAMQVNWWANSVRAGLANRAFCIQGEDGLGRTNVSTFHENSWGLSSVEAITAGIDTCYFGDNGALPNGFFDRAPHRVSEQVDGTVPAYGGLSMIGFSDKPEGIPVQYILDMMQNYYQNTQLWTGWYGFRDAYTDADMELKQYENKEVISRFPIYKSSYFAIDQGPILIMIENYRSQLIRKTFMNNPTVQSAMNQVFTIASNNNVNSKIPLLKFHQNTPNPFSRDTEFIYEISSAGHIRIDVYNILGQKIKNLVDEVKASGLHRVRWNGKNTNGTQALNGAYFCQIELENARITRKVLLMK